MKRETYHLIRCLERMGFSYDEARALRRISMTLRRWYELECNGIIQRDQLTDKPYYHFGSGSCRQPYPDRERGAERRLAVIMANHPELSTYLQTDPRGCALYILRPNDVPPGEDPGSYYSRGIAVY